MDEQVFDSQLGQETTTISTWYLLLLGILPVILLAFYVYRKDKNKEPIGMLLKAFMYGVATVPTVLLIHGFFSLIGVYQLVNLLPSTRAFISAALVEEGTKFFFLKRLVWNNKEFDERFDGIVYATFVSLGFACVENLMYIFNYVPTEMALTTSISRGIFAVPAHFLFAVIMGYYFGLARFSVGSKQIVYLGLALLMPILFHGGYDYFLMAAEFVSSFSPALSGLLTICFYIFDIVLWRVAMKNMRKHQEEDKLFAANNWMDIYIQH